MDPIEGFACANLELEALLCSTAITSISHDKILLAMIEQALWMDMPSKPTATGNAFQTHPPALSNTAMLSLLTRLEKAPRAIVRLVMLHLESDKKHLKVLKCAGPCIRAEVVPVLHRILKIDIRSNKGESLAKGFEDMPFLKYVQKLDLVDIRRMLKPALPELISTLSSILDKMPSLRVVCYETADRWNVQDFETLKHLSRHATIESLIIHDWCKEEPANIGETRKAVQPAHTDEHPFVKLRHLNVTGSAIGLPNVLWPGWTDTRAARGASQLQGLVSLNANGCFDLDQLLPLLKAQANSLRHLVFSSSTGVEEKSYDFSDVRDKSFRLPHLKFLSSHIQPNETESHKLFESTLLLHIIVAPELQIVHCANLFLGHDTNSVLSLGRHWRDTSPVLQAVIAQFQEDEADELTFNVNWRMQDLVPAAEALIQAFKEIFGAQDHPLVPMPRDAYMDFEYCYMSLFSKVPYKYRPDDFAPGYQESLTMFDLS